MSCINIVDIQVLNNPTKFSNPFQFEITFDCVSAIQEDLVWTLTYVGSAETTEFDQVLETIRLGPINLGVSKFVFQANAPDIHKIPASDVFGVTVLLLTCSYKDNEFVRVGYYVNNDYSEPLDPLPPTLYVDKVIRKIVADQPRVTHFAITWDHPEPEPEPSSQDLEEDEVMNLSDLTGEDEEEEDEEEDSHETDDDMDQGSGGAGLGSGYGSGFASPSGPFRF